MSKSGMPSVAAASIFFLQRIASGAEGIGNAMASDGPFHGAMHSKSGTALKGVMET